VNAETFAAWCEKFMGDMLAQEAAARTIEDQRLSGKEWYAANAEGYEDLILNEDEAEQLME